MSTECVEFIVMSSNLKFADVNLVNQGSDRISLTILLFDFRFYSRNLTHNLTDWQSGFIRQIGYIVCALYFFIFIKNSFRSVLKIENMYY